MIDLQTVRKLALALPQVDEHTHWERPAFRVNKKIFATVWPIQQQIVIKLSLFDQTRLISQDSITYSVVSGKWGQKGYTVVQYDNLNVAECYWLLSQSWQLMAPKRLGRPDQQTDNRVVIPEEIVIKKIAES